MKTLAFLLALLALTACATADGGTPAAQRPKAPGPISLSVFSVGDTTKIGFSWGAGARATSYSVTRSVSATNGTWTVVADSQAGGAKSPGSLTLPNTFSYTAGVLHHTMWLSAIPWDSVTITVSVASVNSVGTSASVTASKRILRSTPGVPGPITFDSTVGLIIAPNPATVALGSSRVACAFDQFANGAVTEWTADKASCDSIAARYVPPAALALATPAQQAHTDSLTKTCVSWTSSLPTAVRVTPNTACSSAVVVAGLQLTLTDPGPLPPTIRNVALEDARMLIAVLQPWGRHREWVNVTCLRPGIFWVRAAPEGSERVAMRQVTCLARPQEALASFRFPTDALRSVLASR